MYLPRAFGSENLERQCSQAHTVPDGRFPGFRSGSGQSSGFGPDQEASGKRWRLNRGAFSINSVGKGGVKFRPCRITSMPSIISITIISCLDHSQSTCTSIIKRITVRLIDGRPRNIRQSRLLHRSGRCISPERTVSEIWNGGVAKGVQFRMNTLPASDSALDSLQDFARIRKRVVRAGG